MQLFHMLFHVDFCNLARFLHQSSCHGILELLIVFLWGKKRKKKILSVCGFIVPLPPHIEVLSWRRRWFDPNDWSSLIRGTWLQSPDLNDLSSKASESHHHHYQIEGRVLVSPLPDQVAPGCVSSAMELGNSKASPLDRISWLLARPSGREREMAVSTYWSFPDLLCSATLCLFNYCCCRLTRAGILSLLPPTVGPRMMLWEHLTHLFIRVAVP